MVFDVVLSRNINRRCYLLCTWVLDGLSDGLDTKTTNWHTSLDAELPTSSFLGGVDIFKVHFQGKL